MAIQQTIAVLGAETKLGSWISKSLSSSSQLLLFAPEITLLDSLSEEIHVRNPTANIELMSCCFEASWEADIIILCVPASVEEEIATKICSVATGKIVINVTDHSSPGTLAVLEKILSASKLIQGIIPNLSSSLETFEGPELIDMYMSGDDAESLAVASDIFKAAGVNPIITYSSLENQN